ncbi:MAG: class II glutamine amidotransferase [Thermoprotei archaeon]
MCELFGLSSNKNVNVSFTWRGFLSRGNLHRDGWGVAWYSNNILDLVKEPKPATQSPIAKLLINGIRGNIIISHVRTATKGIPCYVNTHPFVRKIGDQEWVFAHNGDVSSIIEEQKFKLNNFLPLGDTDSEYAFCYIMERIQGLNNDIFKVSENIKKLADEIGNYGKFNFLLSNGKYFFAYTNRRDTLYYLIRHPPHKKVTRLVDEDFEVRLEEIKAPDEFVIIIATKPLTDEEWNPLYINNLYVFTNGKLMMKINNSHESQVD